MFSGPFCTKNKTSLLDRQQIGSGRSPMLPPPPPPSPSPPPPLLLFLLRSCKLMLGGKLQTSREGHLVRRRERERD